MALSPEERAKVRSARARVRLLKSGVGRVKGYLARNDRRKASRLLTAMGGAADKAEGELAQVETGEAGPGPAEPAVETDQPGSPNTDLSDLIPKPKDDAVKGERLEWKQLKAGTDYVDCQVVAPAGAGVPKGVRLFGGKLLPCGLDWTNAYINTGLAPTPCGLRLYGVEIVDPKGRMEFKATDVHLVRCWSKEEWGVKIRHGERIVIDHCKNFRVVTIRDVGHEVRNCPGCVVKLYAGNHPAHYEDQDGEKGWKNTRKKGGGENFYSSAECYVEAVEAVIVGLVEHGKDQFKARGHVIHPDMREHTREMAAEGTVYEARG